LSEDTSSDDRSESPEEPDTNRHEPGNSSPRAASTDSFHSAVGTLLEPLPPAPVRARPATSNRHGPLQASSEEKQPVTQHDSGQTPPSDVGVPPTAGTSAETGLSGSGTAVASPLPVPLLPARDLINGRLEAVAWYDPVPGSEQHPLDGRAMGLLRYRVGNLDIQALPEHHPLETLTGGQGNGGQPPRVLHAYAMLPDDSQGRRQEIVEALLLRAAKLAAAEDAGYVLVNGDAEEADLLGALGLRPLQHGGTLWYSTTTQLRQALRGRPGPAGLKVSNCESS
jgi:hypothetical protein